MGHQLAPGPSEKGIRMLDLAMSLLTRFHSEMLKNAPGTRLGADRECLHDMRVASRRARAVVRVFERVIPRRRAKGLGRMLGRLGRGLGAVRDLDVVLEKLRSYAKKLRAEDRTGLVLFREHLVARRDSFRRALIRFLDSGRFAAFMERQERWLACGPAKRPLSETAGAPIHEALPALLEERLQKLLRVGRTLGASPGDEALHRMRIRCKRLRYACEFAERLYGSKLSPFLRQLIRLQGILGAHQDAVVAAQEMQLLASQLGEFIRSGTAARSSFGGIGRALEKDRLSRRRAFKNAWASFAAARNRREFVAALASCRSPARLRSPRT